MREKRGPICSSVVAKIGRSDTRGCRANTEMGERDEIKKSSKLWGVGRDQASEGKKSKKAAGEKSAQTDKS